MIWEAWFVLLVIAVLIWALARNWASPDLLTIGALATIVMAGAVTGSKALPKPSDAVTGFGSPGAVTVAALFVVVAGLNATGAMALLTQRFIGRPTTTVAAQLRLLPLVAALSSFMNNTPVVAMFMPVVHDICKKTQISPAKLFLPLAYAATFGGTCTLIGTSTNVIVYDLVTKEGLPGLRMFDIGWVGLPAAIAGLVLILVASQWLLPDRKPAISLSDDPRQYTVEMTVEPGGMLVGQTIEQAGLRHLPGLYLAEIERDGEILAAVGPQERLYSEDRLIFVGIIESVVDLRRMRGLVPATDQTFKLDAPQTHRCLVEAVVSDHCPLVGRNIREGRFRSVYNAVVIAVARSGKRLSGRIGDIVLQPGDTLLLEAHADFVAQQRNSRDFYLVSGVENSSPPRHDRAWIAFGILAVMVALVTLELIDILPAALLAALAMIGTRCCTSGEARQSIEWSVLLVIGAAIGIGNAMEKSGAAQVVASRLIGLAGGNPWMVLAMVYLTTLLFTEMMTNNAAAVLAFQIALSAAERLGVSHMPFVIAVMIGASAGFATPFGYQTNLMVFGPGGYRFSDYLRIGIPLDLLFMAVTVALAPLVFPF